MNATLGEVCTITMGQAPTGESYNSRSEGVPLIAGAGDFGPTTPVPSKYTTRAGTLSADGDIVLSIRASIGAKVWSDDVYCLGRGVAGLRAGPHIDRRFLWHWLTHVAPSLAAKGRGATFLQVSRQDIDEMPIELPPLTEQGRIASILDQADSIRALRRRVADHLDALTWSVFHEMFGSMTHSVRWPVRRLGDVAGIQLGKMLDTKRQTGSTARPYLRNANVQWLRFDLGTVLEMDFDEKDRRKFDLRPGDVVICEGGEPGRAAVWRGELGECYYQKALHRARVGDEILPDFLARAMKSIVDEGGLKDYVTSATIAHLTAEKLRELPVPVPPLELQHESLVKLGSIAARREDTDRLLTAQDELSASLQARAFRGEL